MNIHDKCLYESKEVWNQNLQLGQKNLVKAIIDFFPQDINTALDVGCGDGKLTEILGASKKCSIIGLDVSEEALSRCNFKTIQGDATNLPFKDGEFDVVLTTDMLEHLPHTIEKRVWDQLFRVAKKWVLVAVPFRENILDATAKCHHCGHQYHVNWHMRSYDWPELISRCSDSYEVDKIILTGEPWTPYHPLETKFRRKLMDEWSGWGDAICPNCKSHGDSPDTIKPLSSLTASALGSIIYSERLSCLDFRSHSEILVMYRHKSVPKTKKVSYRKANFTDSNTNEIVLEEMTVENNLIPYPSVARVVQATDEGLVLQFPAYSPYDFLEIKTIQKEQNVCLSVEDGKGLLFNGELNIDSKDRYVLLFPRKTITSYYGILVRIKSFSFIKSIKVGDNRPVNMLKPLKGLTSYYLSTLNQIPTYIQVTATCYFDNINLTHVKSVYPNWINVVMEVLAQQERKEPKKRIEDLISERDKLQAKITDLILERDEIEARTEDLILKCDKLPVRTEELIFERDELKEKNHQLLNKINALNNRFEVRIINKLYKVLKNTERIFIK